MLKERLLVKPPDIQNRSADYALRAIQLVRHLNQKKDGVAWILAKQYLRCATSIGANLAEAQSGETRSDFIHKCAIAQKEARESAYWLSLMLKSELVPAPRLQLLIGETNEITAILTRILVNAKKNAKTPRA